eukprot:SAG31_NODE_1815_length_7210_cov_7.167628_2_plen_141_part_00
MPLYTATGKSPYGYVLYKIGCADDAITGSNGTTLVGRCNGCHNGSTEVAGVHCPPPDQYYERACQDALYAESLDGPWTRQNLSGFYAKPEAREGGKGSDAWDWLHLNLGLESHAPTQMADGTLVTFTRAYGASSCLSEKP